MWIIKIFALTGVFCTFVPCWSATAYVVPKEDNPDIAVIISTLTDYVKSWGFCYHNKYDNSLLIAELEQAEKKPASHNPALIMVSVAGIDVLYQENLALLQKYNFRKNHMKPACNKKDEGRLKFSTPVLSVDKLHALVLTETICGPDCGSVEWLLFAKNQFGWYVEKRILKLVK